MIKRGDIYEVSLPETEGSCVQGGRRPVIVVQNNIGNQFSPTTLICPITSKKKRNLPTHMSISCGEGGLRLDSTVLCEQSMVIDKEQLIRKIGEINNSKRLAELNQKLCVAFGLEI